MGKLFFWVIPLVSATSAVFAASTKEPIALRIDFEWKDNTPVLPHSLWAPDISEWSLRKLDLPLWVSFEVDSSEVEVLETYAAGADQGLVSALSSAVTAWDFADASGQLTIRLTRLSPLTGKNRFFWVLTVGETAWLSGPALRKGL